MDYKNLKDAIKAVIKKNGAQEITGQIMQDALISIVSKLGGNKTFAGVATPTTVPDTTDANIFYIAGENGTYVNFGGAKVENEAAVFVQASGGTWRTIYTGIQTAYGVDKRLQEEHEQFDTALDRIQTDLTQFKQTEFADVKEDVEGHTTEIAKNKSDITKINGEIATLNEASNTAADELVRIEGKVDANLKDAVVVFLPSTNTGVYKGADILSFTSDTPTSTVTAYMSQYWDKLVKLASGKISGSVYAESNNVNCTGGSCIGGTQFGYLKIEIENYQKGGLGGEVLVLSCYISNLYRRMEITKNMEKFSFVVVEGYDMLKLSNDVYNLANNTTLYDGYYIQENASYGTDAGLECLKINMSGIKKLYIIARVSGRAAIVGYGAKKVQFLRVNELYNGEFVKDSDLIEYLYISNVKSNKLVVIATELEYNYMQMAQNAWYETKSLNIVESETDSAYEKDLSINHNKPGYIRIVFDNNPLVSTYSIKSEFDEDVQWCIGITKNGEIENINRYSPGNVYIISANSKYSRYGISAKKGTWKVEIESLKDTLINTIGSLIGNTLSYNVYGDWINTALSGEEISANDEYGPKNEVKTLEGNPRYKNFAYYLAKRNKLRWYDFSFDKATLTDCATKAAPDLNFVLTDDAIISMSDDKPDYITLWYGVNDAKFNPIMQRELWLKDRYGAEIAYPIQESEIGKEGYATAEQKAEVDKVVGRVGEVDYNDADSYFFAKFVGTENDEELTTWCGALNYALPLLMSEYPTAKILIIVPDHEKHGEMLRKATINMAEKWGILYFDLNSLPYWYGSKKTKFENTQHEEMSWLLESGEKVAPTVEGFNKSRYSYDGIRPSDLGHKVISFPIGNKLING